MDEEAGMSSYRVIGRITMGIGGAALVLMVITRLMGSWSGLGPGLAFIGEAAIMFFLGYGLTRLGDYRKRLREKNRA